MKKIFLVCIAFGLLTIGLSCDDSDSGISMYVVANSGLRIREDSNTNSKQVGLVPYGKKVKVLEQSEKTMTISGKKGHWTKVSYEETEGWSFGGFLSATPPGPKNTADPLATKCAKYIKECNEYCEGAGPADGCESIECLNLIQDPKCYQYVEKVLFGR